MNPHLLRPILFEQPERVSLASAWNALLPVAFWLVDAIRPRTIVELGVHSGVSYCGFCQAVDWLKLDAACYGIDTWAGDAHSESYGAEVLADLSLWHGARYGGFSRLVRQSFDESLAQFADGSIDLLHIDGFHAYDAVAHDLAAWLPKLSRRGVVLLHDINVRERGFGVWRLFEEAAQRHPHFAFHHAHGLGILAVGPDQGAAMRWLTGLSGSDAAEVRAFFAARGRTVELQVSLLDLARQLAEIRAAPPPPQVPAPQPPDPPAPVATLPDPPPPPPPVPAEPEPAWARLVRAQPFRLRLAPRGALGDLVPEDGTMPQGWVNLDLVTRPWSAPVALHLLVDGPAGRLEISLGSAGAGQMVRLPDRAQRIAITAVSGTLGDVNHVAGRTVGTIEAALRLGYRHRRAVRPLLAHLVRSGPAATRRMVIDRLTRASSDYDLWVATEDALGEADLAAIRTHLEHLPQPLISIVMPVWNTPEAYLDAAIHSVRAQLYPAWELCIADDASTAPHVRRVLEAHAAADARIRIAWRERNGHISAASNTSLAMARGSFIALMDHDDVLPVHALYMVAVALAGQPDLDLIYSDEDKIDEAGRRFEPYFKPDFDPDLLLGQNYISHLGVYRTDLVRRVGGFREGFEGSQDYDLALRVVDQTTPARIRHLPHILYHWRVFKGAGTFSTVHLDRATDAARRALAEAHARAGRAAVVGPAAGVYHHAHAPLSATPTVTAIVPTRDRLDLVRRCVEGLLEQTDYPALDVIVVDNGSVEPATLAWLAGLATRPRVQVLRVDGPFNFSRLNNVAAERAQGELLALVNNDIEVLDRGWLKAMVARIAAPDVGVVGARLLYPDRRVQHAGVVLGVLGVAAHVHAGLPAEAPGYFGRAQLVQRVSAVTAACMLVKAAAWRAVGGLDEVNLAVAFNDVDLCLRIGETGLACLWTPEATLIHHESASRGSDLDPSRIARFQGEVAYMQQRWGHLLLNDPFFNPNLSLQGTDHRPAFPTRAPRPWRQSGTSG
ncbi:glycosyltransferase [Zavarzinia sp. CC-PAN008]|uniref:glycosyltransferase n=1 Tax=Zavarzinia sp. CC-PAN008 TaxID=3243332 RepID=UPI003F74AB3C